MSKRYKALVARIAIVLCMFLWGCFFSPPVNITGTWIGTLQWTSGPASGLVYPVVLTLVHDDHELTGTVRLLSHSSSTFEIPIVQGSARGVSLSLTARGTNPHVPNEPTIEFEVEGRFDQTSMSGEGTQSINATTYTFEWEASLTTDPLPAGL